MQEGSEVSLFLGQTENGASALTGAGSLVIGSITNPDQIGFKPNRPRFHTDTLADKPNRRGVETVSLRRSISFFSGDPDAVIRRLPTIEYRRTDY